MNGEIPPAIGDFLPGAQIASYRIDQLIGRGGMAAVYRATDVRLDRQIALKVLIPELARNDTFRQRFVLESRAGASLDHPHVIPVFEAGEADGVLYIAMRLVSGHDVRALIEREGHLAAKRTGDIVSQVADALDAAHAHGLVHRDVKPANMLLADPRETGRPDYVYLSDFGLSKQSLSSTSLTGTGQFLGTLDYMSPEQISGREVDGRTDLYALGCATFEMLTGQPPFRREANLAVMWAQVSAEPPSVRQWRPDLAPAVDSVIGRALAKSPADRQDSCTEFAESLREACAERPAAQGAGWHAGESQAGGSQAGGSQAGVATAGGSQAGGSQAGVATAGGSQAGGSQAGVATAGGAAAGGAGGAGPVVHPPTELAFGVVGGAAAAGTGGLLGGAAEATVSRVADSGGQGAGSGYPSGASDPPGSPGYPGGPSYPGSASDQGQGGYQGPAGYQGQPGYQGLYEGGLAATGPVPAVGHYPASGSGPATGAAAPGYGSSASAQGGPYSGPGYGQGYGGSGPAGPGNAGQGYPGSRPAGRGYAGQGYPGPGSGSPGSGSPGSGSLGNAAGGYRGSGYGAAYGASPGASGGSGYGSGGQQYAPGGTAYVPATPGGVSYPPQPYQGGGAPQSYQGGGAPPPKRGKALPILIGVLIVVILAGVGFTVLHLHSSGNATAGKKPTTTVTLHPRTSATSTPSTSPSSPARSTTPAIPGPEATVRDYYAAVNNGQYARAWQLNPSAHSLSTYAEYRSGFDGTQDVALTIGGVSGDTVSVSFIAYQTDGSQKDYSGSYTVQNGKITGSSIQQTN